MTKPDEKLKPCPFCGGEARITIHEVDQKPFMYFTRRYAILCDWNNGGCGAEGLHSKIKEEAIQAWNKRYTRAKPKVNRLTVERVEEIIKNHFSVMTFPDNDSASEELRKLATAIISELED
jgi:hypothetical protein